jgi:hypothetical protein
MASIPPRPLPRATNRVPADSLRELLEEARTGALAHVDAAGAAQALPVAFRWRDGRYLVGLPRAGALAPGAPVALSVDDGWYWWDLRAVLVRGALAATEGPPDAASGADLAWFELVPRAVTAWDYGRLHEEP